MNISKFNRDFRFRVFDPFLHGSKRYRLYGVSGLVSLIGLERFLHLINKAYRSAKQVINFKVHGLTVSFYSK